MITPKQKQALEIVRDYGPIRPREFAEKMWPDSEGWKHSVKCGNGSHRGGGMYMAGGMYLAKLRKEGWIFHFSPKGYYLSSFGKTILDGE